MGIEAERDLVIATVSVPSSAVIDMATRGKEEFASHVFEWAKMHSREPSIVCGLELEAAAESSHREEVLRLTLQSDLFDFGIVPLGLRSVIPSTAITSSLQEDYILVTRGHS